MVKITMDRPQAEILFTGETIAVAAELACAVSGIHQALRNQDEHDAAVFKASLKKLLDDDSPVWNAEHELTMVVVPVNKKGDAPTDQS